MRSSLRLHISLLTQLWHLTAEKRWPSFLHFVRPTLDIQHVFYINSVDTFKEYLFLLWVYQVCFSKYFFFAIGGHDHGHIKNLLFFPPFPLSIISFLFKGLIPLLKAAISDIQVAIFANQMVAVDAYSWLHKGAYGCAMELVEGKHTTQYVCMLFFWK